MNKDEFLSEYAVDRRNTCCVKWDDLKKASAKMAYCLLDC